MTSSILRMTFWEMQKIKGIQPPKQAKNMTLIMTSCNPRYQLAHQKCSVLFNVSVIAVYSKIKPVSKPYRTYSVPRQ